MQSNGGLAVVIGLIGGIGSGKSVVAKLLEKHYKAHIINADEIGHQVIQKGTPSYKKIIDYFGAEILNTDGTINRKNLGYLVFNNSQNLKKLNEFTHPFMFKEIELIIHQLCSFQLIVLEAAVMIEAKFYELVDELWFIYSNKDIRIKRLINHRGFSLTEVQSRMKQQYSDEIFQTYADYCIDNSATLEYTLKQIEERLSFIGLGK